MDEKTIIIIYISAVLAGKSVRFKKHGDIGIAVVDIGLVKDYNFKILKLSIRSF
jgi:hypothetical protein